MKYNYSSFEEVPQDIKDRIRKEAKKLGYKVKLISRRSNWSGDQHVFLVLAQGGEINAYTVWAFNSSTSVGLCEGRFDMTYKDALLCFSMKLHDMHK